MSEPRFSFRVEHESRDGAARAGVLRTRRGEVRTPVYMPVGTAGAVKTLAPDELRASGASIILGNTYHLSLRPGIEVLERFGGLHRFMAWDGPILTDSGGFQVFSLKKRNKIREEGVLFASHIDGSRHWLTPEGAMGIQRAIGAEILMVLDECCPYPVAEAVARAALERSERWARRCRADHPPLRDGQALFGIVQRSTFPALRLESLERTAGMGFEGLAIGGLSVGEPKEEMIRVLDELMPAMPRDVPRYLMGVGSPEDLLEGVARGVDMFDCVLATRIARHGAAFTRRGRIDLTSLRWRLSDEPIDPGCACHACRTFSRGYLRHLFKIGETLAMRMASLHNIAFLSTLMREAREAIASGTFLAYRRGFLAEYNRRS